MRYAIRSLWKAKTFSAVAVAAIALGVGANTAVFSVVDAVLLRPLPFRNADRIVTLTQANPKRDMRDATISFASFSELAARERLFERLSAYTYDTFNLTGADATPEQLPGVRVTASFFDLLGVPMAVGSGFGEADDRPGQQATVVLSRRFWSRRFAMKSEAVGSTLTLNGIPHVIVGALGVEMPPPFADADVWATHIEAMNGFSRQQIAAGLGYLWAIARLPPGMRIEQVQPEVDAIVRGYAAKAGFAARVRRASCAAARPSPHRAAPPRRAVRIFCRGHIARGRQTTQQSSTPHLSAPPRSDSSSPAGP